LLALPQMFNRNVTWPSTRSVKHPHSDTRTCIHLYYRRHQ